MIVKCPCKCSGSDRKGVRVHPQSIPRRPSELPAPRAYPPMTNKPPPHQVSMGIHGVTESTPKSLGALVLVVFALACAVVLPALVGRGVAVGKIGSLPSTRTNHANARGLAARLIPPRAPPVYGPLVHPVHAGGASAYPDCEDPLLVVSSHHRPTTCPDIAFVAPRAAPPHHSHTRRSRAMSFGEEDPSKVSMRRT